MNEQLRQWSFLENIANLDALEDEYQSRNIYRIYTPDPVMDSLRLIVHYHSDVNDAINNLCYYRTTCWYKQQSSSNSTSNDPDEDHDQPQQQILNDSSKCIQAVERKLTLEWINDLIDFQVCFFFVCLDHVIYLNECLYLYSFYILYTGK